MKFPRNAKLFTGTLDAAPFVSVCLMLIMLGRIVYTPGIPVPLQVPLATEVAGSDAPMASVAVDAQGRLYYENKLVERSTLRDRLRELTAKSPEPMALIIQADKSVSHDMVVRLALIAREAGFKEARLATLPRSLPLPPPAR